MKIYTKTGDTGKTSLNSPERILKSDIRVEAYGTIDELNSMLGIIMTQDLPDSINIDIDKIMNLLFQIGSDLATPFDSPMSNKIKRLDETSISFLEQQIDEYDSQLPTLRNFILPGGSQQSALVNFARTIARRAERRIVALGETEEINTNIIKFINRLADYLFVISRFINFKLNIEDRIWKI